MVSTRLYTAIFVVLFASATGQVLVEEYVGPQAYWIALAVILGLSFFKAVLVAGWYQHLRFDPRAFALLALSALVAVLAFVAGSSFSIL